jgi:YVTN family beta-propeller protein
MKAGIFWGLAASLVISLGNANAATAPAYALSKVVPIGVPDRWDYVHYDAPSHRVYIAHGAELSVINGDTGALIGVVTGMPGGTHGIAISHATHQGFTDDGQAGEAVAFNLKTLAVEKRIKAAPDADGIFFDHKTNTVYVIDGDSGELTAINPQTDSVIATVHVGTKLEFGVSGENGFAYVNAVQKHEIIRFNTHTNRVDARWVMPHCKSPRGLAVDIASPRLFSTCGNGVMMVVNADNGAVLREFPIGKGSDAARFDPKTHIAFSSNFDGTLSMVRELSPNKFEELPPIETELGARTMGLNRQTGRIYLVTATIHVNHKASPNDYRHRFEIAPGSVRVLFLDPVGR